MRVPTHRRWYRTYLRVLTGLVAVAVIGRIVSEVW